MQLTLDGDVVRAGGRARERFYDSRGYGRARDGDLDLAPVEAAHLCYRGNVDAVDGPAVVDVYIDPTEDVYPMVPSGGDNGQFALSEDHL